MGKRALHGRNVSERAEAPPGPPPPPHFPKSSKREPALWVQALTTRSRPGVGARQEGGEFPKTDLLVALGHIGPLWAPNLPGGLQAPHFRATPGPQDTCGAPAQLCQTAGLGASPQHPTRAARPGAWGARVLQAAACARKAGAGEGTGGGGGRDAGRVEAKLTLPPACTDGRGQEALLAPGKWGAVGCPVSPPAVPLLPWDTCALAGLPAACPGGEGLRLGRLSQDPTGPRQRRRGPHPTLPLITTRGQAAAFPLI